jgi:hypothetical protein
MRLHTTLVKTGFIHCVANLLLMPVHDTLTAVYWPLCIDIFRVMVCPCVIMASLCIPFCTSVYIILCMLLCMRLQLCIHQSQIMDRFTRACVCPWRAASDPQHGPTDPLHFNIQVWFFLVKFGSFSLCVFLGMHFYRYMYSSNNSHTAVHTQPNCTHTLHYY